MPKDTQMTVAYTDGTKVEVTISPLVADMSALEEKFDISSAELQGPNARVKWTMFLVYRALQRASALNGEAFETWVERVASVDGGEEADPTIPAPASE